MGHPVSLVRDWSSKHVVFTNGASPEVAAAAQRDPRSWQNWLYRNAGLFRAPAQAMLELDPMQTREDFAFGDIPFRGWKARTKNKHSKIDWARSEERRVGKEC